MNLDVTQIIWVFMQLIFHLFMWRCCRVFVVSVSEPSRVWLNEWREAWLLLGGFIFHKSLVPLISLHASYQCNSWVGLSEERQEAPLPCVRGLSCIMNISLCASWWKHQEVGLGVLVVPLCSPLSFQGLMLTSRWLLRATDEPEDCVEFQTLGWFELVTTMSCVHHVIWMSL